MSGVTAAGVHPRAPRRSSSKKPARGTACPLQHRNVNVPRGQERRDGYIFSHHKSSPKCCIQKCQRRLKYKADHV